MRRDYRASGVGSGKRLLYIMYMHAGMVRVCVCACVHNYVYIHVHVHAYTCTYIVCVAVVWERVASVPDLPYSVHVLIMRTERGCFECLPYAHN